MALLIPDTGLNISKVLYQSKHLIEHSVQLVPGFTNTVTIVAVNHKDETLCVLEVVSPQRSDLKAQLMGVKLGSQENVTSCRDARILKAPLLYLVLTTHVPHCKADVLVLNSLHVESCRQRK